MTRIPMPTGRLLDPAERPTRAWMQWFESLIPDSTADEAAAANSEQITAIQDSLAAMQETIDGLYIPRIKYLTNTGLNTTFDFTHNFNDTTTIVVPMGHTSSAWITSGPVDANTTRVQFSLNVSGVEVLCLAPPVGQSWPT